MKKVGDVYTKNGINYLVLDDVLISRFKARDNDSYYEHNGVTYSLGISKNTVDVSSVTDMVEMFAHFYTFNADISHWDVSSVTDMDRMFYKAYKFNSDISNWDVSSVTDMDRMFYGAHQFNADISNWDVSGVNDMDSMFYGAHQFNADISNWDVSGVIDMRDMFAFKIINDINNHNIPKWYTDRHQKSLTITKQKEILERYKDLPDEDKKAILKIVSLGLDAFIFKGVSVNQLILKIKEEG